MAEKTKTLFDSDQTETQDKGMIIRVAFDAGVDSVFDYLLPDTLGAVQAGQRVEVPFGAGNKLRKGFCVRLVTDADEIRRSKKFHLKTVQKIIDAEPLVNEQLMRLAEWISEYYVCPVGQVLAAMVPAAVKKGTGLKEEKLFYLLPGNKHNSEKSHRAKQKAIIDILADIDAGNSETAVEMQRLLELADCTEAPLKSLVSKGIVGIIRRKIIKSLPAIPENLTLAEKEIILNNNQQKALTKINENISSAVFGVTLLHGVTDSGKTELYIRAIQTVIGLGRTAIVLLPEIALTAQTVQRFAARFKNIAVMHSGLGAAQRNQQWHKIRTGGADVVIGARSAVFAPLEKLGLLVVDEEHEPGYKQDTIPRYHGRDVAVKRAQLADAHCILGSATPSLETLVNCRTKKHYSIVELPNRVRNLPLPTMKPVDMSAEPSDSHKGPHLISGRLLEQLREILHRKEQAILLLNRRGYSNFIFCPSCRHSLHCHNCDVTLTFHKKPNLKQQTDTILGRHITEGYAICHYCLCKTLVPRTCPLCGRGMAMIGLGSQRLEEELRSKLPQARLKRVDSDAMASGPQSYYKLLADFAAGKIDILAGTQILAKGLHFPNVTLVGIISADTALSLPDFRANERTFQLISQVAGRAGRAEKGGMVIVQTFMPQQPAIQFALRYDYAGFTAAELVHRQKCNLPPYWRMAIVGLRDMSFDRLQAAAADLRRIIDEIIAAGRLEITVRGPMPATISRIQRFHRMQIVLQAPQAPVLGRLFSVLRSCPQIRSGVKVTIDVDPVNLL